jgi:hypothetical protein
MFRFGFAEAKAFLEGCGKASDALACALDACAPAMAALEALGFQGRAADAAQAEFAAWYAQAAKAFEATCILREAVLHAFCQAQRVKGMAEAIPASVGAPARLGVSWEASMAVVLEGSEGIIPRIDAICGECIAPMQDKAASMGQRALGVRGGLSLAGIAEGIESQLEGQKRALLALRGAVADLIGEVAAFESAHARMAYDVLGALGACEGGGSVVAEVAARGWLAEVLQDNATDAAALAFDIAREGRISDVGILKVGRIEVVGDTYRFTGFKMAQGEKMTSWCRISNAQDLPKPAAALEYVRFGRYARGLGAAGGVLSVGGAWIEEYRANPSLPEDRRASDAAVEASINLGGVFASAGATAATGFALGTAIPGAGNIVGAAVGFAAGAIAGFVYNQFSREVLHKQGEDGRSAADDMKDAAYSYGQAQKKALEEDGVAGARAFHGS